MDEKERRSSRKRKLPIDPTIVKSLIERKAAEESRRERIQGKGRPIIATEFKGYQFVAAGDKIHYSPADKTKTFADFLGKYLQSLFTPEWGNAEIAKPLPQRHTIMQWYDSLCRLQKEHYRQGEIFETPLIGLVFAYNSLAYNLYLLDHNAEVQNYLLQRLKDKNNFHAAYYETHVAAWFILAGFELTLENEADPTTSHCEFTAKSRTGQCYSVEAKCRQPFKEHLAIGNQLAKALAKWADHPRVVFIEMNMKQDQLVDIDKFQEGIVSRLRKKEIDLLIKGEPAPPAYIFVTNIPHHLHLNDEVVGRALLADGFKIDDFGYKRYPSIVESYKARQKHADIYGVASAFENYIIPSTFDGELAEFAFGNAERRFNIGERHKMEDGTIGILVRGIVVESQKKAYLTYNTDDGKSLIYTADLSETELSAYKSHPETFFGKIEPVGKEAKSAMDLFEFFYTNLKNTPRDKMLEWFSNSPDIAEIEKLSTEEMALVYAERHTLAVIQDNPPPDVELRPLS